MSQITHEFNVVKWTHTHQDYVKFKEKKRTWINNLKHAKTDTI